VWFGWSRKVGSLAEMVGLWISHSGAEPPIDRDGKGTEGGDRAQRGVRRGVRIWHAQRGGESRRKKRDVRAWKPGGARGPGDPRHRREVSRAEGKHGKERGGRCSYTQMESNVSKAGPEQVNASENGAASTHPTQTHRHEGSGALAPRNEDGGDGGL